MNDKRVARTVWGSGRDGRVRLRTVVEPEFRWFYTYVVRKHTLRAQGYATRIGGITAAS